MLADFYAYLSKDAPLSALLGGEGHIYPDVAPEGANAPYLVYGIASDGGAEEVLGELSIRVSVYADSALKAEAIAHRLKAMLNVQDAIAIPSTAYRIRWCKQLAGSGMYEPDTRLYNRALVFSFKFTEVI